MCAASVAASDRVDSAALSNELAVPVLDVEHDDLPEALKPYEAPPPPLGQLYGFPVVVDENITRYASIVFQPFGESDYVEVPYDDFARQEQPRVASFTRAGELPKAEQAASVPAG